MQCPYCGVDNRNESRICEVCGRPLPARRTAPLSAGEVSRSPYGGRPTGQVPHPPRQGGRAVPPASRRPAPNYAAPQGKRPASAVGRASGQRPYAQNKPKERWNPKFLAACAGILILLIAIPVIIAVVRHSSVQVENNMIQTYYSGAAQKTSVVMHGKVFDQTIPGRISASADSADGLARAVLTENGDLYYITRDKLSSVAKNVDNFILSADGSGLAYVIETAPETTDSSSDSSTEAKTTTTTTTVRSLKEEAQSTSESTTEYVPAGADGFLAQSNTTLYLYNAEDGTAPKIADHISAQSVALSANGDVVSYTQVNSTGDGFEGYHCFNNVKTSIGRNVVPIAISNDTLHMCYVKFERLSDVWVQKLFAKLGETDTLLGEFSDGNLLQLYVNQDFTEIIYSLTGSNGNYFFYAADHDKEKLSVGYTPIYSFGLRDVCSGRAVISPLASFAKSFFSDAYGTAQYIDDKYVCVNTGAVGVTFRVNSDGKTLYYLDKDEYLYSCSVRKLQKAEIDSHVMTFELSADGDYLYYINSDNELHCVKGGKNTLLAEKVNAPKDRAMAVTDDGYVYFLQNYSLGSGTLCYLKKDGKPTVVDSINNVYRIVADTDGSVYYYSDYSAISGTFDVYYGKSKKYTQLLEKVE